MQSMQKLDASNNEPNAALAASSETEWSGF